MTKFAVSMPDSTLAKVEQARKATGESRSQFLRRAAETIIREEQEREWDRQYVEGYRRMPETEEDTLYSEEWATMVAAENPWEGDVPASLKGAKSAAR